jgi:hypothetical protein
MEPKTPEQTAKVIAAINVLGFEADSTFVDYELFKGSFILKFDFSTTDPDQILKSAIQQAYWRGRMHGEKDAQYEIRRAIGL